MFVTFSWVPLRRISKGAKASELPATKETTVKEIRALFAAKWPELQIRV